MIGVLDLSLKLYGVRSLKEKRSIVKPLLSTLRNNFNCAVIESDAQDSHGFAVIQIATLNTSGPELDSTLEAMIRTIEKKSGTDFEVIRREVFS